MEVIHHHEAAPERLHIEAFAQLLRHLERCRIDIHQSHFAPPAPPQNLCHKSPSEQALPAPISTTLSFMFVLNDQPVEPGQRAVFYHRRQTRNMVNAANLLSDSAMGSPLSESSTVFVARYRKPG